MKKFKEAAKYISDRIKVKPEIGLILGSGLGIVAEKIEDPVIIPYEEIPSFPVSTVTGHAGRLVIGSLEEKVVIAMQGRFHYYEGYTMQQVTLPIRVMKLLGIEKLIVTNAAGALNRFFVPGDFMFITDHVNMMGNNPLIGQNYAELGSRFPDMTEAYSKELISLGEKVALEKGILTRKGIYVALSGPSYETPAEIRFLARNGLDAVGMSTVPEVIIANHMNISVLGISCITNMAAGILEQPLNHQEVMETAEKVKPKFISLVCGIINKM